MRYRIITAAVLGAVAMLHVASASAQLNNKPYTPGNGGYGMSSAARQAILEQQLSSATPGDVIMGPNGTLLNVTRGENGLAVVTTPGGAIIPQYSGRSNSLGGLYVDPGYSYFGYGGSHGSINSWTGQVDSLGGRDR